MSSGWRTREDIERDMGILNWKEDEPIEEEDLYGKPDLNLIKKHIHNNGEEYFDERLLFKHAPKPDFNLVLGRKLLEESDKAEAKKTKQVPLQRNVVSSKSDVNLNAGPSVPIFTDLKAFPPLQNK